MDRRRMLASTSALALAGLPAGALLLPVRSALAHHGWSSFDPARPLFLAGRIATVHWRNPHMEFELDVAPGLALPSGLAERTIPAQTVALDAKDILSRTQLPQPAQGRWTIELAPLTRMRAWAVEPLREGETVEVVGYTFAQERPERVLRAEWLFRGGKAYGMRSSPAG